MTRFAFGAKCGRPGTPAVAATSFAEPPFPGASSAGAADDSPCNNAESAVAPSPTRPKKWRRLITRRGSKSGFMGLGLAGIAHGTQGRQRDHLLFVCCLPRLQHDIGDGKAIVGGDSRRRPAP